MVEAVQTTVPTPRIVDYVPERSADEAAAETKYEAALQVWLDNPESVAARDIASAGAAELQQARSQRRRDDDG